MTATTRVPLGTPTLNRKWQCDVNTGSHDTPVWVGVFGITDFTPATDPQTQDTSDFDSGGYQSNAVTALGFSNALKVSRKSIAGTPTAYDPGQEFIRLHAYQTGTANTIEIRWYEMEPGGPRIEAYTGYVGVQWSDDGGGMEAVSSASVTLTGQGARTAITHPDTVVSGPFVTAVLPFTGTTLAAAGGGLLTITGTGFSTATVVTIGGNVVNATTDWEMINDSKIVAKAPAHAAGAVNVTVTNPGGTSPTGAANSITYV